MLFGAKTMETPAGGIHVGHSIFLFAFDAVAGDLAFELVRSGTSRAYFWP